MLFFVGRGGAGSLEGGVACGAAGLLCPGEAFGWGIAQCSCGWSDSLPQFMGFKYLFGLGTL